MRVGDGVKVAEGLLVGEGEGVIIGVGEEVEEGFLLGEGTVSIIGGAVGRLP